LELNRDKKCNYKKELKHWKQSENDLSQPMDIEDLCGMGIRKGICPFYYAKKVIKDVDIIFMPYNYLLDFEIFSAF